jgi:hypothetical protein
MRVTRGTSRTRGSGSLAKSGHHAISESRETRRSLSSCTVLPCRVPLTKSGYGNGNDRTGVCARPSARAGHVGGAIRCHRVLRWVRARGARPRRGRFHARAASGRASQQGGRARLRSDRTSPGPAAGSRCRRCPRCPSRASVFQGTSCGGAGLPRWRRSVSSTGRWPLWSAQEPGLPRGDQGSPTAPGPPVSVLVRRCRVADGGRP